LVHLARPVRRWKALGAWRLALLAAAAAPAAHAGEPAAAAGHGDNGDFTIDAYAPAPDQPSVGGRANLELRMASVQTSLQAAVESGGAQGAVDPLGAVQWGQSWTGNRAQLTTTWTPSPAARLELSLGDQLKRALSQLNPLAPGVAGQLTSTWSGSAKVTAVLTPSAPVELRLGGETASGSVDTLVHAPASATATNLRTDTGRVFADLTWRPTSRFSLEAGDAVESLGVTVQGSVADSAAYAYPTPHIAGTLTPWSDAEWRISAEHAVSPPNPAQYASFVQAADRPAATGFQPDHAWRYSASLKQTLAGRVTLSASVTQSDLQSVTDLGPVGLGQAPVSIGAGERREVDLAVTTPVALPGLPPVKFSASANWRRSQVTDPFTGARRPISGDAAYGAQLNLTGAVGGLPLNWGLKAQLTGPQAVYQMSQVDLLSSTAGLGGVINYRAGTVTIGLQVDNIVGGQRTDTSLLYVGSRAYDVLDATRQTHDDGRAVRISLSRSL
jgi:hypothetical protein